MDTFSGHRSGYPIVYAILLWIVGLSLGGGSAPCSGYAAETIPLNTMNEWDTSGNLPVRGFALERFQQAGKELFEQGHFLAAIDAWRSAAQLLQQNGDVQRQSLLLSDIGAAYQLLGQIKFAESALNEGYQLAMQSHDPTARVLLENNIGSLDINMQKFLEAERHLTYARELSMQTRVTHDQALTLNNLGNLWEAENHSALACQAYRDSLKLSHDDLLLQARAHANLMGVLCYMAQDNESDQERDPAQEVQDEFPVAMAEVQQLPATYGKAQVLLSLSSSASKLAVSRRPLNNGTETNLTGASGRLSKTLEAKNWWAQAVLSSKSALQVATAIENENLASVAMGNLGEIAATQGQDEQAFQYNEQARFLAQKAQSPSLLYRWEWQRGRLFKQLGNVAEAIAAYQRAVDTFETLCNCNQLLQDNPRESFRTQIAPLYYELADLYLNSGKLSEARDTVERLKSAEISDYYRDDCVISGLHKMKEIEMALQKQAGLQHAAIIYYIALPNRTEILLSLASGLKRVQSKITLDDLNREVPAFRRSLETSALRSPRYLTAAQRLYQGLIDPIKQLLITQTQQITTLVFVPDGVLRTVPMAALYDGHNYLVEQYTIAVIPGLRLMDPQPLGRHHTKVFIGGISEAIQGFNALPKVRDELHYVAQTYATQPDDTLLNERFQKNKVLSALENGQFSIVHIASHAQFGNSASQTFLLAYDNKISLDDLEAAIRPHQFQGTPVELLVLSACETASVNEQALPSDRAALGLAGIALKSGARSALATLWGANDEVTLKLITLFYDALKQVPKLSKAEALRQAQIKMIHDGTAPADWAPYLIIGNWL